MRNDIDIPDDDPELMRLDASVRAAADLVAGCRTMLKDAEAAHDRARQGYFSHLRQVRVGDIVEPKGFTHKAGRYVVVRILGGSVEARWIITGKDRRGEPGKMAHFLWTFRVVEKGPAWQEPAKVAA